jgi:hypothetical protein
MNEPYASEVTLRPSNGKPGAMEGSVLGGSEAVVRGALSSSRLWLVSQEPNLATI